MLNVTVTPQETIEARKHTCNVCGYYGVWSQSWGYYEWPVGTSHYNAFEVQFVLCSDECREKAIKEKLLEKWRKDMEEKYGRIIDVDPDLCGSVPRPRSK